MTAGNGKGPELPGLEGVGGETRGGVLGMKDEMERLGKDRAQLVKQIKALDRKIAALGRRAFKALAAN